MPEQKRGILDRFLHGNFDAAPSAKAMGATSPAVPFGNSGFAGNVTSGGQMAGGALSSLFAGSRIDYARAVGEMEQSSAIMACVQWVQRVFPEAPARVVTRTPKGDEEIDGHPLTLLLDEPNPHMSGAAVFQALLADYNIHGNAYLLKFRTGGGRVAELWWEPQTTIRPTWDPSGQRFVTGYQVWRVGKWYPMEPQDVVHIRWGIDPRNTRLGISPLRSALRSIYTDEEAEAYTAIILHNMGMPGVIISPAADKTILPDEAQRLTAYFTSRFTGDGRGSAMVSSSGLKLDMLSFSPQQLDLTKLRALSEARISGLLGVPPIVAGLSTGLEHGTYSNYGQAREAAYSGNLMPTYRSFADTLTRALLRDDFGGTATQFVDYNVENVQVLQEDQNHVSERIGNEWRIGVRSQNEARVPLGLDPLPDGDRFIWEVAPTALPMPTIPPARAPSVGSPNDSGNP